MCSFSIFFALSIVANIINGLSMKVFNGYVTTAVVSFAAITAIPMTIGLIMAVLHYKRGTRTELEAEVKEP
jgi:uncharacterized paraquat-inducible protein A